MESSAAPLLLSSACATFSRELRQHPFENQIAIRKGFGVANGTRTRNSQNHNLELYH